MEATIESAIPFRWLAAGLALACSAPAAAQSQALLDCAVGSLDASYRSQVTDEAMAGNLKNTARLRDAVNSCARSYSLPTDKWPDYFYYSLTRIERDEFARRLTAAQIPVQVIDDAMDFGPYRSNPVLEGSISDAQINKIYNALRINGVDVNAVEGKTWKVIGVYTQAASSMWNARRKLG